MGSSDNVRHTSSTVILQVCYSDLWDPQPHRRKNSWKNGTCRLVLRAVINAGLMWLMWLMWISFLSIESQLGRTDFSSTIHPLTFACNPFLFYFYGCKIANPLSMIEPSIMHHFQTMLNWIHTASSSTRFKFFANGGNSVYYYLQIQNHNIAIF